MNTLSFLKSFSKTSPNLQLLSQFELLKHFCKSNITGGKLQLKSGALNYVEIANPNSNSANKNKSTLVLSHGFGSGLGFYYPNYDALSKIYDRVISFDWLGMGASSRDKSISAPITSNCGNVCKARDMTPLKASEFFIDSLEELRVALKIENFVLAGHSLGGYLSGRYALKYPQELRGLVLISPVGIPAHPANIIDHTELSIGYRLLTTAWKSNFTPQSIIRWRSAQKGEDVVRNMLQRRFGKEKFNSLELDLLSKYMYQITAAPACGEYALNSLLTPIISNQPHETVVSNKNKMNHASVYAKEPLESLYTSHNNKLLIPSVLVLYGDTDWLYYNNIQHSMQSWKNNVLTDVNYVNIPQAGHHIYLDNPDVFHSVMDRYHKKLY